MVLTLELPIRTTAPDLGESPFACYESRFGALPTWLDELSPSEARALLRYALRRGTPLNAADLAF